jgi:hypothetical protein
MKARVAILVVHAEIEPFASIKRRIHPEIYQGLEERGIDLFYLVGRGKSKEARNIFNRAIERNRHSRYYIISRLFDFVFLNLIARLPRKITVSGPIINVDTPEDLRHLGFKLITAIEYLLKSDYDWVLRTTTSSIVNLDILAASIEKLSKEKRPIFAGAVVSRPKTHDFIVGSCLLMNKQAMNFVHQNRNRWDHSLLDDVALGRLASMEYDFFSIKNLSVSTEEEVGRLGETELAESLVMRCKTQTHPRSDGELMKSVHERLKNSQK